MSTLKRNEPTDQGCARLLSEQLESAISELTRKDGSAAAAANALRKADAALSLIEPALPRDIAKRERSLLQRITREIENARRPTKLLAMLESHLGGAKVQDPAAKAYRKLLNQQAGAALSLNAPDRTFNPLVYRLVADLAELRGHVGNRGEVECPPDRTPPGLRRAYTAARRAVHGCPSTAKDAERAAAALERLAMQLAMLNRCGPALLKPQRKMLAKAGVGLHDYALTLRLRADLDTDAHRDWAKPTIEQIDAHAKDQQPAALLGSALAETPASFVKRVDAYWQFWREG